MLHTQPSLPNCTVSTVDPIPQNCFCSMSLAENKPFRRNLDAYITQFNEVSNKLFL